MTTSPTPPASTPPGTHTTSSAEMVGATSGMAECGPAAAIDVFRDSHGFFTMVAVDQRESLRHMLREGQLLDEVDDATLAGFKTAVVDAISGAASGILLDQQYGLEAAQRAQCPVILAADILSSSEAGGPVDIAAIDDTVTAETVSQFGAQALKLLLPWHPQHRSEAIDLAHAFMARCRDLGLPGVLEGVVRPRDGRATTSGGFAEALIAAAVDLAPTQPDLYKTEVVFGSPADRRLATTTAEAITDVMACPWVVLSSGVAAHDFATAVAASAAGGASGFLAGRAVWSGAATSPDPHEYLRSHAATNLQGLTDHIWGTVS
ncbi:hypothetical protein [Streptomyces sp. NPDC050121]|uniref:hypothetical protein n=1 Tax=Streptomyces sp. NPDC050121 TaxID=3365601 RepID=UPI003799307A